MPLRAVRSLKIGIRPRLTLRPPQYLSISGAYGRRILAVEQMWRRYKISPVRDSRLARAPGKDGFGKQTAQDAIQCRQLVRTFIRGTLERYTTSTIWLTWLKCTGRSAPLRSYGWSASIHFCPGPGVGQPLGLINPESWRI